MKQHTPQMELGAKQAAAFYARMPNRSTIPGNLPIFHVAGISVWGKLREPGIECAICVPEWTTIQRDGAMN
jgi:hypothetical protein